MSNDIKIYAKQVNTCGTCRACCIYHTISSKTQSDNEDEPERVMKYVSNGEEEKLAGIPCPQLNPNKMKYGCTIHSVPDKPYTCSTYVCAYASGLLGNNIKFRPDNLGVIMDTLEPHKILRVVEIDNKALDRQLTKRVIWGAMEAVKKTFPGNSGWKLSMVPMNFIGKNLASYTVITPEELSIGKNNSTVDEETES